MIKTFYLFTVLSILWPATTIAQRAIEHDDFDTWKRIRGQEISNNGSYVAYHLVPGKGDQALKVKTHDGKEILTYTRAENSNFSADSRYLIFKIVPALDSVNVLKRNKTKDKDMPKDSLGIFNISNGSLSKIARVKSYKLPDKWNGYVFYQLEEQLEKKDTAKADSIKKKKPKKGKKVGKENGFHLVMHQLSNNITDTLFYVLDYVLAEEGNKLLYVTSGKDSTIQEGTYYYDLERKNKIPLTRGKGKYKQLVLDKTGLQAAFLADLDTTKILNRDFQLRYWQQEKDSAILVADSKAGFLADEWVINENGKLQFSDNGEILYFGTSPQPVVQDTSLLPDEIVKVEIWNYQNGRLHTQQNAELDDDKKKSYMAAYYPADNNLVQLGSLEVPDVHLAEHKNAPFSLGTSNLPYEKYISWEGFPRRTDVYLINNKTGEKTLVKEDLRGLSNISTDGHFLYWVNSEDTTWTTYETSTRKQYAVSKKIDVPLADELNDQPNYPYSYGMAGWTIGDEDLLIYDRYDIWQVDPTNKKDPKRLTNGRETKTRYRYIHLDEEDDSIDPKGMLLSVFNEENKKEGYASLTLKSAKPKSLLYEDYAFSRPKKALGSDDLVFTKESFELFPDLLASNLSFKNIKKLSSANPEQGVYLWGSVEMYHWTSLDGVPLDGLLYKPANFDPSKKYPMITYFYERNSDNLNRHWGVVPIRSIVNPAFYTSRGYIVFIPDIVYKTGYPGESCYDAVIPGVTSLIKEGFIDEDKIGAQGHSWGGYQTAYLATRTNIFAAIESGAPVANMISAYGGIRWWTGLSRMFQYEHTQSRIGGTLWEYPLRYIENSPIFFLDKVQTPMLIMHNDKDGHVPWYQGIELYVGMRRLGKPAWMLNYNDEPHWPTKWENIRDFNIRMAQFFDHYLKGQPMPHWMKSGVPAIEKGVTKGYGTANE